MPDETLGIGPGRTTHSSAHRETKMPRNELVGEARHATDLLSLIEKQANQADASRSISDELITAIKESDMLRLGTSVELGGKDETLVGIANELRTITPLCTSTAWVLWNHTVLLHHTCALLGPPHIDFLRERVSNADWFCQGAGAGTEVAGARIEDKMQLNGVSAFASGSRYADWTAIIFNMGSPEFTVVDMMDPKIRVDPTWEAMSVRASSTDHVYFDGPEVPISRVVPIPFKDREMYRTPDHPVINPRYREDWVALSAMWLGAMASGLAEASFKEMAEGIKDRIAVFGTKMAERQTIHVNLGRARSLINAATDTAYNVLRETDERIAAKTPPTEQDYFRQTAGGMQAILLCDEAMKLIQRILGGNGLREGTNFERHFRDFQAMPLHIIPHVDRITEQYGRLELGLETTNTF